MNQKRRRGVEGVRAEVIDRGLFEGCCRLLAGQEQLEQHQNCSISNNPSPQVWRGQTEILPITESEVSTPPTIVKGATWEWLQPSSPSYSTSLVHYSVVSIWQGGGTDWFLSPPHPSPSPWIVPPEVFMGRLAGCSAHQEIKVSSSSKCAVAQCDLFNSNRVNITDACKAGITVAELDVLRRDSGSVSFLLRFTHTRIGARFSVMDNHPRDVASQYRGFLSTSVKSQLLAILGQFQEREH